MKLVAAKNLHNSKTLRAKLDEKDPLFVDQAHLHKGARFSIGETESLDDLSKEQREGVLVLVNYGLVLRDIEKNKDAIATIDKEAKAEAAAAKAADANRPVTAADMMAAQTKTLQMVADLIKAQPAMVKSAVAEAVK